MGKSGVPDLEASKIAEAHTITSHLTSRVSGDEFLVHRRKDNNSTASSHCRHRIVERVYGFSESQGPRLIGAQVRYPVSTAHPLSALAVLLLDSLLLFLSRGACDL